MKKTLKIAGGFLAVLVLLLAGLVAFLDQVVVKTVNAAGPAALGVPVRLQEARIRPFRGRTTLRGLHVGNPEGYKTDGLLDLGSIVVKLDRSSLLSDVIVVKEIAIDGLVVTYEKGLLNSNLGALIDQLSAGAESDEPAKGKPAEEETSGRKVVIEKLTITGSKMNFSVTGAAALTGGGAVPLPLPPITLTGLGREKEGVTLVEAIQNILKAIAGATGTAIVGAGNLIGDGVGALGTGAAAIGSGTLDAGKAVVGGTVDAGKAVVDGAAGALKAVNPFSKKE
ncbi:MAG TPA: hypothetical protein P5204_08925 [Kiritimatiellia bacterium]|nr:hypothetical protein [Kiritimatiellia bacterium]